MSTYALNEIRLEKALAAELLKTEQIIQRTGLFDPIDRIYGEIGAEYQANPQGGAMGGNAMGGGMGGFGGGLGGGLGDDLGGGIVDMGGPGMEDMGDIGGSEGLTDMGTAPAADAGTATMENRFNKKPLLVENTKRETKNMINTYLKMLNESANKENDILETRVDITDENLLINESIQNVLDDLMDKLSEK